MVCLAAVQHCFAVSYLPVISPCASNCFPPTSVPGATTVRCTTAVYGLYLSGPPRSRSAVCRECCAQKDTLVDLRSGLLPLLVAREKYAKTSPTGNARFPVLTCGFGRTRHFAQTWPQGLFAAHQSARRELSVDRTSLRNGVRLLALDFKTALPASREGLSERCPALSSVCADSVRTGRAQPRCPSRNCCTACSKMH